MSTPRSKSFAVILGAVLIARMATPGVAAGGFFDAIGALFNGRAEHAYAPSGPLSVTVRPRGQRVHARPGRQAFSARRPPRLVAKQAIGPAYARSGPLSVTVRPGRQAFSTGRPPRRNARQAFGPAKPLLIPMDSVKDPTWYLRDPTLRRGDIVVLKTGVMVFDGVARAEHAGGEFTPLRQARLLSPTRRQAIAEMAAGFKAPAGAERTPFPPLKASLTEVSALR